MIDREHDLPIVRQAEALNISRGSVYYLPRPVPDADLAIMQRLDRLHLEYPFAGSRMLRGLLAAEGCRIGRRHVKTLMQRMGIEALYRRPRTTKPESGHKIYPYLLRGVEITRPNQVWAMGIIVWRDNVFVERLRRSVKYEEVYLRAYKSVGEARASIGLYFDFYNQRRPHSSLDGITPDRAYFNLLPLRLAA
jgi:transposase InsO family protein